MKNKIAFTDLCAIVLHKAGFKPHCTHFIDETTIIYGYGKLNGWIGVFRFNLPLWYASKYYTTKY